MSDLDVNGQTLRAFSPDDIEIIDNEPRVTDARLAVFLGYARVENLRDLATRHREALERFGEVSPHRAGKPQKGTKGGRPSEGLAFNKKQALFLCGKTDLPAGIEMLIAMVEVFDAFTAGRLPAPNPIPSLPPPTAPEEPPCCKGCGFREHWAKYPAEFAERPLRPINHDEANTVLVGRLFIDKAIVEGIDRGLQERAARLDAALKALTGEAPSPAPRAVLPSPKPAPRRRVGKTTGQASVTPEART